MARKTAKKLRKKLKRYDISKGRAGDQTLIPVGNNSLGAKDLFKEKGMYATSSYPRQLPTPLDTFHKYNNLYGRVDAEMNPIFLAEDNLRQLPVGPSGDTMFALGFVADAFKDLQEYFQKAIDSGRVSAEGTVFGQINAMKAWDTKTGIHHAYNTYWEEIYSLFVGKWLDSFSMNKILTFDDFVKLWLTMATKLAFQKPITRVAFITSSQLDPRASGLVIDLVNGKHDDDYGKYIGFIRDPNFSFFARSCERHGFYVDKNAPWRIYADITNPYMKEKIEKFGTPSMDEFFTTYYLKASNYEMDNLKIRLFQMYDLFLQQYPDVTKLSPKTSPEVASTFLPNRKVNGGIKTQITYESREKMTWEELNKRYSDEYWLRLYVYLRAVETHKAYDQREFDREVRLACEYMNYVGLWRAIEFVDKVYHHRDDEVYEQRTHELYQKSLKKDLTSSDTCDTLSQNINEVKDYRPAFYF